MATEGSKTSEYEDFKCQFDDCYAASVVKGHKEWMEKSLIPEIRKTFRQSNPYRILSVGSGTGYPDQGLLELLSRVANEEGLEKRKIVYTVSEPDPKAVDVCKRNLAAATKGLNCEFNYEIAPSEKYLLQLEEEFDLIHFVHVLSWLKDHETILARCYERLLAKNGLIAVVDFNKEYMGGQCHCDDEECGKQGTEETRRSKEDDGNKETAGENQEGLMYVEVDLIANKHGWNCKKFEYNLKIDLSEAGNPTDTGRGVACAWMHVDPTNMSDEEKEKTRLDFIASFSKDQSDGEAKYFYFLNEMIYFLTN